MPYNTIVKSNEIKNKPNLIYEKNNANTLDVSVTQSDGPKDTDSSA